LGRLMFELVQAIEDLSKMRHGSGSTDLSRVRSMYLYVFACFNCGRSDKGLELHHIFGRESPAAFNACPLCRVCHAAVTNSNEERARFFFKNVEFLLDNHYELQPDDLAVVAKHPFLIETEAYKRIFDTNGDVDKNLLNYPK